MATKKYAVPGANNSANMKQVGGSHEKAACWCPADKEADWHCGDDKVEYPSKCALECHDGVKLAMKGHCVSVKSAKRRR